MIDTNMEGTQIGNVFKNKVCTLFPQALLHVTTKGKEIVCGLRDRILRIVLKPSKCED